MRREKCATRETEQTFESSAKLADHFRKLRIERNKFKKEADHKRETRPLPKSVRMRILKKTGGRCHVCGGMIEPGQKWRADYVIVDGKNRSPVQCCLPAHNTTNNSRWFYSPEELMWIFKLGIWFRAQIEKKNTLSLKLADKFVKYDKKRSERTRGEI